MKATVVSTTGDKVRDVQLADHVFSREVSEGAIYHAIRNELANMRVGTASTKGRAEVSFSGRKMWRQKGTGRARSGSRRNPVWVHGGTIFGPKPRDYSYRLPRKMKRVALQSILTQKAKDGALIVVEDFEISSGKTKDMVATLRALTTENRVVLVTKDDNEALKRSARNIPWLRYLNYQRLRAHDLFYARSVIVMESAASELGTFFATGAAS